MADTEVGAVSLHAGARLVFTVSYWKGKEYANVRKYVDTSKYSGPTKSGLAMPGEILVAVIDALRRLQGEVPGIERRKFAGISKSESIEIAVSIVPPDDLHSLPYVDVREFFDTPEYSGPTKKGVRFSWEKLPEVLSLLLTQAEMLRTQEQERESSSPKQVTMFPNLNPTWIEKLKEAQSPSSTQGDPILAEMLPEGVKDFPDDFLSDYQGVEVKVHLPHEPIEIVQQPDGTYIVRTNFGFCHSVRNACEGNYVLRELRRGLLQAYERKSGHRPTAEYHTKQVFRRFGLPWID